MQGRSGNTIRNTQLQPARVYMLLIAAMALFGGGCVHRPPEYGPGYAEDGTPLLRFSIQAGAFRNLDNAIRMTETLRSQGVEAVYFIDKDGLYKVRFGDFPDRESAERYARDRKAAGLIAEYYIVSPDSYAIRIPARDRKAVRRNLVADAHRFIGCPYRWGGTVASGFDCSGLVMTVYRLNGLILPRTAAEQFEHGRKVSRRKLKPGDLVFFRTAGGRRISHVGIYIGDGEFIHAPGQGKKVQRASLREDFYDDTFAGGRQYLRK